MVANKSNKSTAPSSILALDKSTYRYVKLPWMIKKQFRKAGATPRPKQPILYPKAQHPGLSPADNFRILAERRSHHSNLQLLDRLWTERARLIHRIEHPPTPLTPLPLYERLSSPSPVHIPPPISSTLHFHRSKILKRTQEFEGMLLATVTRLEPIFERLKDEDLLQDSGRSVRVSETVRDDLWRWYDRLQDLSDDLKNLGRLFTNAEWRNLRGALKRIGKVSFEKVDSRLQEICLELAQLNITLP
ncbi:hypothetical protein D9757_015518 [Collybiopsis confluens]|uniref:Uncharacterized protein n=1 Tax=Collybiopsis confluens TaxID=2823264 RepID=A0A8H5FLR1_9AGAR|nr:hypothetical protein D9757_015518 [Collybiopsis confluens]